MVRFLRSVGRFWLVMVFALCTVYFAHHNRDAIAISLPPWLDRLSLPAWMVFGLFFLVGSLTTTLFLGFATMSQLLQIRRLRRLLSHQDDDIKSKRDSMLAPKETPESRNRVSGISQLS